jgi:hypothetical protein
VPCDARARRVASGRADARRLDGCVD